MGKHNACRAAEWSILQYFFRGQRRKRCYSRRRVGLQMLDQSIDVSTETPVVGIKTPAMVAPPHSGPVRARLSLL